MGLVLTVSEGPHRGKDFRFNRHDVFLVGRSPKAHFRLGPEDRHFSRIHFLVEVNPPRCRVTDLNSRNGTFVNDVRIVGPTDLHHGDTIRAGITVLRAAIDEDPEMTVDTVPQPIREASERRVSTPARSDPPPACGGCDGPPGETAPWLCPLCESSAAGLDQVIPDYRLVRELGAGGMGVVYRAVHLGDGKTVALKLIRPAVAGSPSVIGRFLREAKILRRLEHPHIVPFHEMGEAAGLLYFAMEFVPGTDAERLLRGRGRLTVKSACRLMIQILKGLEHAHSQGFVHRDIKPANMLLREDGRKFTAVLADFGLAGVYQGSALSGLSVSGTDAGGGTPRYMAPEQLTDFRNVRPAADLYSVAATLYKLVSGQYTYDFPASAEWMLMLLQEEPIPLRERAADLPEGLAEVVHRALAREPADRFPDARHFREALVPFAG